MRKEATTPTRGLRVTGMLGVAVMLLAAAPVISVAQSPPADEHDHAAHDHVHEAEDRAPGDGAPAAGFDLRPWLTLAMYSVAVVGASLFGGWVTGRLNLGHTGMQMVISFVGGLMLGIGTFHMLPHAVAEMASLERAVWWMTLGILCIFFMMRAFHFHQHAAAEPHGIDDGSAHDHDSSHTHSHDYHHHHVSPPGPHRHSWIGVALGMTLHSLIDGIALAASVWADAAHGGAWMLFGIGTFLAVALHKPLDAVSITSLMKASHWSPRWISSINGLFALTCPIGALLFVFGIEYASEVQHVIVGCALAFSAGVFLCIALVDLLPEMEFHSHSRVPLTLALLFGLALAYGIGYLEPEHLHDHGAVPHAGH